MNYIPYDSSIPSWISAVGIAAAALILLSVLIFALRPKDSDGNSTAAKLAVGFLVAGLLSFVVAALSIGASLNASDNQRDGAQIAQIRDHYGIELSSSELYDLDYPFEEPEEDFKVFGHIDKQIQAEGTSFSEKRIYLVWADGKLGLSESSNGKDYTALEPRKEADR